MSIPPIEIYNVKDEGDLEQLAISGPIKDMLNSEMVILLVIDAKKIIYLWKGVNAKVRRKFIAARVSQDLRGQKGLNFKVESIDQGDEPQDFISAIGGPVVMDTAPAMAPAPGAVAAPAFGAPTTPTFGTPPPSMQPTIQPPGQPIIQPPAQPAIISSGPAILSPEPITQTVGGIQLQLPNNIEESVKIIISELEKRPPPPPYTREIVFIGPYAFSIVETKKAAFGQEQIEHRWELASPPEGQFIAEEYTPRAIIQSGKILAVELMKGGAPGASSDAQIPIFKIKYQK